MADDDAGDDARETILTPGRARDVGRSLKRGADAVRSSGFNRIAVPAASFSPLAKGAELAREHATSHHILGETLRGFELDLDAYGDAVVTSASGLEDTDADSATLFRRMATIEPTGYDRQRSAAAWKDEE